MISLRSYEGGNVWNYQKTIDNPMILHTREKLYIYTCTLRVLGYSLKIICRKFAAINGSTCTCSFEMVVEFPSTTLTVGISLVGVAGALPPPRDSTKACLLRAGRRDFPPSATPEEGGQPGMRWTHWWGSAWIVLRVISMHQRQRRNIQFWSISEYSWMYCN